MEVLTPSSISIVVFLKNESIFSSLNRKRIEAFYDDGTATESIRFSRKTSSMQTIQLWSNGNDEYKDEPGIKMFVRKLLLNRKRIEACPNCSLKIA
jgi:hypothetical protein